MKKYVIIARLNTVREFLCGSQSEAALLSHDLTRQGWKILSHEERDVTFTERLEIEPYGYGLAYRLGNEKIIYDDSMTYPQLRQELKRKGILAPKYSQVKPMLESNAYWIGDVVVEAA